MHPRSVSPSPRHLSKILSLWELPDHLVVVVLRDFVGATLWDLAQLDLAFTSRSNRPFLHSILFNHSKVLVTEGSVYALSEHLLCDKLCCFLHWAAQRHVHSPKLHLDLTLMAKSVNRLRRAETFPGVGEVVLFHSQPSTHLFTHSLTKVLRMFPRLSKLDLSEWEGLTDVELDAVLQCGLALTGLVVGPLEGSGALARVVAGMSGTLEKLYAHEVDQRGLDALLRCGGLKKLRFTPALGIRRSAFTRFFAELDRQGTHIVALEVDFMGHVGGTDWEYDLSNYGEILHAILPLLPQLVRLALFLPQWHVSLFSAVLGQLRRLRHFVSNVFAYHIYKNLSGCEVQCDDPAICRALLERIWLPVHRLTGVAHALPVNRECMELLARSEHVHVGKLKDLHLRLSDDVRETEVMGVCRASPMLRSLYIYNAQRISDSFLFQLSAFCPLLQEFGFEEADSITDPAMMFLVNAYSHNPLRAIYICGCKQLGNETYFHIARQVPHVLYALHIHNTAVTKEACLQVVMDLGLDPVHVRYSNDAARFWVLRHIQHTLRSLG